jgi:hypothetical protein
LRLDSRRTKKDEMKVFHVCKQSAFYSLGEGDRLFREGITASNSRKIIIGTKSLSFKIFKNWSEYQKNLPIRYGNTSHQKSSTRLPWLHQKKHFNFQRCHLT